VGHSPHSSRDFITFPESLARGVKSQRGEDYKDAQHGAFRQAVLILKIGGIPDAKGKNYAMRSRIVIIEDEKDIVELVRYNFRNEGFEVVSFGAGRDGLEALRRDPPDLLLLDILLPDVDGFEICRRLRGDERLRTLPIIFLTAKGEEVDRVLGLEIGGDGYVVKPFSPRELVARAKVVLRRRTFPPQTQEVIELPDFRLDAGTREVVIRGRNVDLSNLEFKLLHFLASHPRWIFTRDHLLDEVWGRDRFVTPRTVDVHVRRLREKIEAEPDSPQYVQTVRGAGYRFVNEACEIEAHPGAGTQDLGQ
jgi:DNA-binding response OmpR family regulator